MTLGTWADRNIVANNHIAMNNRSLDKGIHLHSEADSNSGSDNVVYNANDDLVDGGANNTVTATLLS